MHLKSSSVYGYGGCEVARFFKCLSSFPIPRFITFAMRFGENEGRVEGGEERLLKKRFPHSL
jgi:hypothetical protein